jgi:transposase
MNTRGLLAMSHKEIKRYSLIERIFKKELTQVQVAKALKISERQVRRLCRNYERSGVEGLISKRRGKASNHKAPLFLKKQVIELASGMYRGFGPTLMSEKLLENNNLNVSKEWLRQLLIEEGLWIAKGNKQVSVHQSRERRACFGELIQIDGSPHDWFEGRSAKCCLIVFIDDATSRILYLHFEAVETTQAYFRGLDYCLNHYGLPLSLYSDRHSIFRVNNESGQEIAQTQFERACATLNIETINANSPQAKGRVERANKTLQDRLVKEMRLLNISNREVANRFLEQYKENHNKRFSKEPREAQDAHTKNTFSRLELDYIFSLQHSRKLSKNLELSYKNQIYQIVNQAKGRRLQQSQVTVCEALTGKVYLLHQGKSLEYKIFDKDQKRSLILNDKELNAYLDKKLTLRKIMKPAKSHPWFHSPISHKAALTHQEYFGVT